MNSNSTPRCLCALIMGLALLLPGLAIQAETIEIRNAHVVDVRTGTVLEDQRVLVEGELIVDVSATGAGDTSTIDTVIDAQGAYLVPGLMDMHFHALEREHVTLGMLHGVTTIRNMWGNPQTLVWLAEVEEGLLAG